MDPIAIRLVVKPVTATVATSMNNRKQWACMFNNKQGIYEQMNRLESYQQKANLHEVHFIYL